MKKSRSRRPQEPLPHLGRNSRPVLAARRPEWRGPVKSHLSGGWKPRHSCGGGHRYNVSVISVTDARGAAISLPRPPRRIISLVPSTTESVHALGAGDRLVGVTRYCVLPTEAREKTSVVGGTKSPRLDVIRSLKPDLILGNKEENREQDVRELETVAPVYVAFPRDLTTALEELQKLGALLQRDDTAGKLVDNLALARTNLIQEARTRAPFRFLYLIWQKPYMAAGTATFIDALIREAGGRNAVDSEAGRYPQLTVPEIEELRPDVVLFSSEPFPFEAKHTTEFLSATSDPSNLKGRTLLVDGQLLSWHGARLRDGIPYLADLAREIVALGGNSR